MSSARDEIFATIRRSLGVTGQEATRRDSVAERLERAPKGLIPARAQVSGDARLALFRQMAEAAQASVSEVDDPAQVPGAIATYLRDTNLPATIRMGEDLRLAAMPWQETALDISKGPSGGGDLNGVSHAFAGIAETGTLVLTSGPENPTTLNFLPDNHIVVVSAKDISGEIEEVWAKLRFVHGKGGLPRAVNFVTGPSRSGDIEQTIYLGAHGPRRLHIIMIKG
jgi:L-lactate dehydrogenase complex protein LldG